jgi:hypothetical protein
MSPLVGQFVAEARGELASTRPPPAMSEDPMAPKQSERSAKYYIERLLEDEYVQRQLLEAAGGIRSAYGRVATKRAKAAEDKELFGNLRRASTAIRKASIALRRPEPEPPRRGRAVAVAIAVLAGTVLIIRRGPKHAEPAEQMQGAEST